MAYRGEDLDLQTPQTWVSVSGEPSGDATPVPQNGKRSSHRPGAILVDETVLACCNYAYDLAQANRSAEVRIDHLLNAMSRIDTAAVTLEERGVRVAALRRETATIIASDIPAVSSGSLSPHRSDALADLLKAASALAARRNAAAGVEDILQALLEQRGAPASELFARFAPRATVRDGSDAHAPLSRPDLRLAANAPLRPGAGIGRAPREAFAATPADAIQNSRIEALEQMVRALAQSFSAPSPFVSIGDVGRESQTPRPDQTPQPSAAIDRRVEALEGALIDARGGNSHELIASKLDSIEAALGVRLEEMAQSWATLSKKLEDLEVSIKDSVVPDTIGEKLDAIRQAFDLTPISNRLDIIEEAVLTGEPRGNAELGERFTKLEGEVVRALSAQDDDGRMEKLVSGVDRVDGLHEKLDEQHGQSKQAISELVERLSAVESAIAAEIETAAAKHQAYTNDLSELHEALMKLNQNQHTLAGSMDQWRTDAASDVANILNRLTSIDHDNALPVETLNALNAHMDTMNRLIIERYHRRNRFRFWLFGTDDWIGASWRSQKEAIETERLRVKAAAASST